MLFILAGFALAMTEDGARWVGRGVGFLEFYAGVFALVLLSATVGLGLLTTERVFLSPSNRVRAQLAHRATAMIGMAYLITHLTLMISLGHVPPTAIVAPVAGIPVFLGACAFLMFVLVIVSGFVRGRFAITTKPWIWRTLHASAYLSWPVGILHGMTAGRPPAWWVAWSYIVCLAAVGGALIVRVMATMRRPELTPEWVKTPEVDRSPIERPIDVNAPVSLDAARRKYRQAG
ncbi:hypothetical protein [Nonomuraea rhizosphaerae]|uniref:hypothetical protein n=1 Tax=Nonomuraea rhizosphaerae TaxID=2665663 RepID=UPI001C5FEDD7|nr:hypothetical protein [Nonomuraea rhizosphaerae]